jgi:hypothetical protein
VVPQGPQSSHTSQTHNIMKIRTALLTGWIPMAVAMAALLSPLSSTQAQDTPPAAPAPAPAPPAASVGGGSAAPAFSFTFGAPAPAPVMCASFRQGGADL